ncbi:hypothetical protein [Bartonella schoenbuchensis]|uniref:hypothetical protein n=1 Tax=Bartonella schoenbuchensis TaxID=165694 RepID=UPI00314512D6
MGGRIEGNGRSGVGINVTGGGDVTVERVNISEVERGIKMEGSGNLTVKDGSITGSGRGGVGIDAKSGSGNVTVDGVNVSGFTTGVEVSGGKTLKLEGGTMIEVGHSGTGVKVGAGVKSAELTGVEITKSGGGGNRGVEVKGGTVKMERVNISGFATGVYMETGVTGASLTNVNISRAERGIYMDGSGTLTVSGTTTISFTGDDGYGVKVGESVTNTRLTDVKIMGNGGSKSKGVWVKGGAVVMERVTITGVKMGIMMKGKGTFTVEGVGISFTGGVSYEYGIGVGDKVTRATLTGVTIVGSGKGSGVFMMGGEVTMERVNVSQVATGIWVTGGTLIMKEGTKIGFTKDYGIKVGKGVTSATLTKVEIVGSNKGKGVVWESAGTLTLDEVKMLKVATGVEMKKGTLIMNEGTTINFMGDYGVMVGKGVTKATLTDVKIAGRGKTGVLMGSTGMLTSVNISGVTTGVEVTGKGMLTMTDGEIRFTEVGLKVEGETTATATVTGTKIVGEGNNGMMSKGVYVGKGNVTLTRVNVSKVETGIKMMGNGVLKVKEGTRIEFMAGGTGVMVGNSVTAHLTGVEIMGNKSGTGVEMRGKTMTMTRVNVSQVETGIYATGGNLTVIGGEIKEVEDGIMMMGNGVLKVRDNTRIWFTKDYGVVVGESVASTTLTNVQIEGKGSGGNGTGIYAMGGSLTVSGGSITGVEEGIKMMGGKNLTVKDGTRIEFTGKYGYGIYVGKGVMANLMGVTIEGKGNNGSGYGVYAKNGEVTVSGGSIKGVKAGIFAVGGGSLTVEDSTRIGFTGSDGYGVYVGEKVRANLTDVTITGSGDGYGIEVMGGAMWLKGTHLRDVAKGMTITKGVTIMEKGSVEFTRDYGIDLTRGYAFLGGVNIKGKETGQEGIKVNEGMLDLYKTNVRDVYKGMTVWRGGIRMEGGEIEFMGEYGIDLTRGYAFLGEVNIEGKETGQEGIKVSEGMLNLYKTNVRDVYKGMTVKEGSVVRMFEGEITFKGEHAISLTKKGYVDLRNVNMTYKGDNKVKGANTASPNFIKVEGGKVLAEKLTMTGNGKDNIQGVKVANGGAVWLKNTTFSNVRSGMTVERGVLCAWREEVLPLQEAMVSVFQGGRLC